MLTRPQRTRLHWLRWTAFVLVVLAYMLSFFHRMAPASIATELQQAFATTGASLGVLSATYFYVYTVMQIPIGVLVDTLGVRKIVTIGGIIAGAGSMLFGSADTLLGAAFGRLLVGLGVSAMFIAMLKINAVWFPDRYFGTMAGLTLLLGNLGAVLAAAPLVWLLNFVSWHQVFVAIGIFSLALGVLTWFLVRDTPSEASLPSMRELDGRKSHPAHAGRWFDGLWEVVRNRDTWPGFWPALGIAGTLFTFAGLWAVPFLQDSYGMPRPLAALHTALLLTGFALGSFFIGALSDRLGARRPFLLGGIVVYLLCWLPLLFALPLSSMVSLGLFALMGIGASGFTLSWAVAKEVNKPALSGMATSVVNTGAFLGAAIFQPLVGWVMDLGWDGKMVEGLRVYSVVDYQWGLSILFIFAVIGLIGALKIRETHGRYITEGL